jgi:amidohydrolase
MDALPLKETGEVPHRSTQPGAAHLCGHDGHSAILLDLAERVRQAPPAAGELVLLFQPAEETGQGAAEVIADPAFEPLRPDITLGLHNLPGWPLGAVVLRPGAFALASRGMIVRLQGRTSHAAYPEQGRSPARAAAEITRAVEELPGEVDGLGEHALATIIHLRVGEVAFGTTPGEGEVMATLRAGSDQAMDRLAEAAEGEARRIANAHELGVEVSWTEEFPATVSDEGLVRRAREILPGEGLELTPLEQPFRWSEDVGHFGRISRLLFFGLGSGVDQPALHAPDYDFPDEIRDPGARAFDLLRKDLMEGEG